MVAAQTLLPVLGRAGRRARRCRASIRCCRSCRCPAGVPVGTLAIGKAGATNAALLAVGILARQPARAAREAAGVPRRAAAAGARETRCREREPILPGATIGVLGSGQLGRMFAIAARRMGYRVHTFSPDDDTPTGQVADREVAGRLRRPRRGARLRPGVSTSSPSSSRTFRRRPPRRRPQFAPVRPAGAVLHTTQHRLREKTFLAGAGFPGHAVRAVRSLAELRRGARRARLPGGAQDGRLGLRRQRARSRSHAGTTRDAAWRSLATREAVLEAFVDFECEVSVVAARGARRRDWPTIGVIENTHRQPHSRRLVAPGAVIAAIVARGRRDRARRARSARRRRRAVRRVLRHPATGALLINELAPRPHNSGPPDVRRLRRPASSSSSCGPSAACRWARPSCCGRRRWPTCWAICGSRASRTGRRPGRFPDVKLHLYGKASRARAARWGT